MERKLYGPDWVTRRKYLTRAELFSAACARPLVSSSLWAMAGTLPTGDVSREPRSSAVLPDHIRVVGRMTRPPERRPALNSIDNIADWLLEPPRQLSEGLASFDEFAWRLVAAEMPLLRATLHTATLHPQFLGTTITWWRDTGETVQVMIAHEVADAIPYEKNPVRRVCYGRETLRRRLDRPDDELDFEVLGELRERGGTDYIAFPIYGAYAVAYMLTFVTDLPGGFSDSELADLARVGERLSIIADRHNQWWITHNLLCAYLGANTGPKVLTGQIRRGGGMELTAVLWSSDLRGFTERSDRLPSERMIAILNALFEAQAAEIRGHGGEILKFTGDGLLAIFRSPSQAPSPRSRMTPSPRPGTLLLLSPVLPITPHWTASRRSTSLSRCMSALFITAISALPTGSISP